MPPAKRAHEDPQSLKEKLHSLQGGNGRGRRNGNANGTNASTLKEVMSNNGDNASTNSGQNEHTSGVSGLPHTPIAYHLASATILNYSLLQISWNTQDAAVLQSYRRAYHLDTPTAFKNPLSHVVLNQGIGRLSPTMARKKEKRRVKKEQLALAVRKNFNAQAVTETNCIVDWLYTAKNQGKSARWEFANVRTDWR
jgi:histone deacetylase complex subunit SAP30